MRALPQDVADELRTAILHKVRPRFLSDKECAEALGYSNQAYGLFMKGKNNASPKLKANVEAFLSGSGPSTVKRPVDVKDPTELLNKIERLEEENHELREELRRKTAALKAIAEAI